MDISTGAVPMCQGRLRQGDYRLYRGHPAQSEEDLADFNRGNAYLPQRPTMTRGLPTAPRPSDSIRRKIWGYCNRGGAYFLKGDYDKAIVDSTEAIRLNPTNDAAYRNRGGAYLLKGDTGKAIADYTEVIRLVPKFAAAYDDRGNAYAMKGDYDKAIADYTEAIRLDPKLATAYSNRSNAYQKKGESYKAAVDSIKAENLSDDRYKASGESGQLK